MKKLFIAVVFLSAFFGYAERSCFERPPEAIADLIYGEFGVSPDIPYYEVCLWARSNMHLMLEIKEVEEEGYKFEQALLGKITCGTGCLVGMIVLGLQSSGDDVEKSFRERYPYSEWRGRKIEYRPGGGHLITERITDRDSYERIALNIRRHQNQSAGVKFTQGMTSLSCGCTVTIPF